MAWGVGFFPPPRVGVVGEPDQGGQRAVYYDDEEGARAVVYLSGGEFSTENDARARRAAMMGLERETGLEPATFTLAR